MVIPSKKVERAAIHTCFQKPQVYVSWEAGGQPALSRQMMSLKATACGQPVGLQPAGPAQATAWGTLWGWDASFSGHLTADCHQNLFIYSCLFFWYIVLLAIGPSAEMVAHVYTYHVAKNAINSCQATFSGSRWFRMVSCFLHPYFRGG